MGYCTVNMAAESLGVSRQTVYNALSDGRLTPHEFIGKLVLDDAEFDQFREDLGKWRKGKRAKTRNTGDQNHAEK